MSNYPTSIDDASSLYTPADSSSTKLLQTTLAASCLSTDLTLQLAASAASVGGPTAYGIVCIGDEQIIYTGVSGNNLTGCIRGANGTSAIGHASGVTVTWRFVKAYVAALQAAVLAVQTLLGVTGAYTFLPVQGGLVNGVLQFQDGGSQTHNCGVVTEVGAELIEFGANEGSGNRFGGSYTQADQGGFIRVDTRAIAPVIQIYVRAAGVSHAFGSQVLSIDSAGLVALSAGPGVSEIVTTVGSPGSDSKLATEKAIRTAIGGGASFVGALAWWSYDTTTYTTNTLLQFAHVEFDSGSVYNTGNGRFTAPSTGYYLAQCEVSMNGNGSLGAILSVNGSQLVYATMNSVSGTIVISRLLSLSSGDYVTWNAINLTAAFFNIAGAQSGNIPPYFTWASIHKVG